MPGTRKQSLQSEDVKKVIIVAGGGGGGGGGGQSYFHRESFKCFETARNATKLVIL